MRAIAGQRLVLAAVIPVALTFAVTPSARAAESRSFVIGSFVEASYSEDGDCKDGPNPGEHDLYGKYLEGMGKSPEEAKELLKGFEGGEHAQELSELMVNRARIGGQPANAYTNPAAAPDPHLKPIIGKHAYGFNLDGKTSTGRFEDPETHEKGIDHQLWRATGCNISFRGTLDHPSTYWLYNFQLRSSEPAWLMTISGENLSKDGPVTVTFDRALQHLEARGDGEALHNITYRVDPDPRSHNVIPAQIKQGTISFAQPADIHMLWNPLAMPDFDLHKARIRLHLKADGTAEAILGGYQPWVQLYWAFAEGTSKENMNITGDIPGLFYALKREADADPDPKTRQNMSISTAYHLLAVPAFVASATGGALQTSSR